jgi:hypothetical protein
MSETIEAMEAGWLADNSEGYLAFWLPLGSYAGLCRGNIAAMWE